MKRRSIERSYMVLFSTAGTYEEASMIAAHLVENKLAACVNIISSVQSVYRWNDQVNRESEVLMIMKTERKRIKELEKAVRSMHSYQTPELIAVKVEYGLPAYLTWISDNTTGATPRNK
jgi:periplasmic divalent cation tolerance protein